MTIGPAATIEDKRKCYAGTVQMEKDGIAGSAIYYNQ